MKINESGNVPAKFYHPVIVKHESATCTLQVCNTLDIFLTQNRELQFHIHLLLHIAE
jgi:hypothetical protein